MNIYSVDYFGFVYIWYDRKKRPTAPLGKWCIGSRMGPIEGTYITSTGYMMVAYNKRPKDFKRRILWLCPVKDNKLLKAKEQYWLNFIKEEELDKKYYNLRKTAWGGDVGPLGRSKISKTLSGRPGRPHTPETKARLSTAHKGKKLTLEHIEKMAAAKRGKPSAMKGKTHSPEAREKLRQAHLGRKWTPEQQEKRTLAIQKYWDGKTPEEKRAAAKRLSDATRGKPSHMRGKKQPPEWVEKRAAACRGKTPKKIPCEKCGKISAPGMYKRWHGPNCRA